MLWLLLHGLMRRQYLLRGQHPFNLANCGGKGSSRRIRMRMSVFDASSSSSLESSSVPYTIRTLGYLSLTGAALDSFRTKREYSKSGCVFSRTWKISPPV